MSNKENKEEKDTVLKDDAEKVVEDPAKENADEDKEAESE